MVIFACKRKLIEVRLADCLQMVTRYLALNRPEKHLARSRRLKKSRIKVTDVSQSSIGTFSKLRHCVMSGRMLLIFFDIYTFSASSLFSNISFLALDLIAERTKASNS